jgi:hypothetical protein
MFLNAGVADMLTFKESDVTETLEYFQVMDPYLVGLVNQLNDQFKDIESPQDYKADPELYNYS